MKAEKPRATNNFKQTESKQNEILPQKVKSLNRPKET